jgi:multidrug efflux pump subunit AcrA (membrane-fusion protein)
VIDRAIASDAEGQKYVYVLDADDKVQSRRITTGSLQPDGLRAVEEGLKPEDWVLSGGILQTRQGGKIKPEQVPMPTLGSPPAGGQPAAAPGSSESQAVDKAE